MQLNFVFESMCVNHAKVLKNFFGHGPKNSVAIVGSDEAQPGAEPSEQEDLTEHHMSTENRIGSSLVSQTQPGFSRR